MTEAKWVRSCDHLAMLAYLHAKGVDSFRKYRILLVAYCRVFLPVLFADERTRHAIETAEEYSDGSVDKAELARWKRAALKAVEWQPRLDIAIRLVTHVLPMRQAMEFPYFCFRPWRSSNYNRPTPVQRRRLGHIIRDVFGNPFRPVIPDPYWLSTTVVGLAQTIYFGRLFDHLSVLADALEDAGCDNPAILGHLRGSGPHCRGCWCLDLLLEKK